MRITLVSDDYLPVRSPLAAQVFAYRTELARRRHRIRVVAPQPHTIHIHDTAFCPVPTIALPGNRSQIIFPSISQARLFLDSATVVHISSLATLGRWAMRYSADRRLPLAISLSPEILASWVGHLEDLPIQAAPGAVLIVQRDSDRDHLYEAGYLQPIAVVPPAIPTEEFGRGVAHQAVRRLGISRAHKLLLSTGRIEPSRHIDLFLQVIAALDDSVHLAILGRGSQEKALRELASELHITPRVHFLGEVPHGQMPAYYAAADALLWASTDDSTIPISILEAQAAGSPVIAADSPSSRQYVKDHATGLLVRRTRTGFLQAIRQLLHRPALRQRLKIGSRRAATTYDVSTSTTNLEAAYALVRRFQATAR